MVALRDIQGLDLKDPVLYVPGQRAWSAAIPATACLKTASAHFSSGTKRKTILVFNQTLCLGEIVNANVAANKQRSIDQYSIEEEGCLYEYRVEKGRIYLSKLIDSRPSTLPLSSLPPRPEVPFGHKIISATKDAPFYNPFTSSLPVPAISLPAPTAALILPSAPALQKDKNPLSVRPKTSVRKRKTIASKNEIAIHELIKWIQDHKDAYLKSYNALGIKNKKPITEIVILNSDRSMQIVLRGLRTIFSPSTENIITLLDSKDVEINKETAVNYFKAANSKESYLKHHVLVVLLISEGYQLNQELLESLKSVHLAQRAKAKQLKGQSDEMRCTPKKGKTKSVTIQENLPVFQQSAPSVETPLPSTPVGSVDMMENFLCDIPEAIATTDFNIDTFFKDGSFFEETQPRPAKKNKQQEKGAPVIKNPSTKLIIQSLPLLQAVTSEMSSESKASAMGTEDMNVPYFAPSSQPPENPLKALQSHLNTYGLFPFTPSDTVSLSQVPSSMLPKYDID